MANNQVREVAKKLAHSIRFRKILIFLLVAVVVLGLVIPMVERGAMGAKIMNEGDGLWFAVTTATGVGYGDMYPVTMWGRIIAVLLEVFGVVLFGSLVAFVSVELTRYQDEFENKRVIVRLEEMQKKIDEMKKHLDFLVKR